MKDYNEIIRFLYKTYLMDVIHISPMQVGVGGETYKLGTKKGNYIGKFVPKDGMNHPELEPVISKQLNQYGIAVPDYIKNQDGNYITEYDDTCVFHLQTFIEGKSYSVNTAPEWLMNESAATLGKIHKILSNCESFPMGIGSGFFEHMTPTRALESYGQTLQIAKENGDQLIIRNLEMRIHILESFPNYHFDLKQLTYCNTHGDFTINQLICGEHSILGVVDWTSACRHPVIWELVRSYLYAEPSGNKGEIAIDKLISYLNIYQTFYPLNDYDREHLLHLYYYQIAVCDYYAQYYHATQQNRAEFLWQADFATKMMVCLSNNMTAFDQLIMSSSKENKRL